MATLSGNLRVNLVINPTPMRGFRWWLAAKILAVAAWVFGGRLIIGVEPEFVVGTLEPRKA